MKEWDYQAYQRKFMNTYCTVTNVQDGTKLTGYCAQMTPSSFYFNTALEDAQRILTFAEWEFEYVYHPSRWVARSLLLYRRQRQVFNIGLNNCSHRLLRFVTSTGEFKEEQESYSRNWFIALNSPVEVVVTPEEKEKALDEHGRISDKLFIGRRHIYYFDMLIAKRDERKITPLVPGIEQELADALKGHEWQLI